MVRDSHCAPLSRQESLGGDPCANCSASYALTPGGAAQSLPRSPTPIWGYNSGRWRVTERPCCYVELARIGQLADAPYLTFGALADSADFLA